MPAQIARSLTTFRRTTVRILLTIVVLGMAPTVVPAKPPNWDKVINSPGRFKVLSGFEREAVLDKETGLVWEKTPSPAASPSWIGAVNGCYGKPVGGRNGFRLPTMSELATLLDRSQPDGLPNGHPFVMTPGTYWSHTSVADPANRLAFTQEFGDDHSVAGYGITESFIFYWCVRAPGGLDGVLH